MEGKERGKGRVKEARCGEGGEGFSLKDSAQTLAPTVIIYIVLEPPATSDLVSLYCLVM